MTVKKMFLFFIQRNKNNGDLVKFLKIYNLIYLNYGPTFKSFRIVYYNKDETEPFL